ncbi:MAG: right-handed parallel beta-helix repeat-containing protein [Bacteroidales bacterium]|nr:right-handed parallel beta-helix repeat-containing protein [Bacteroidales bacterium]
MNPMTVTVWNMGLETTVSSITNDNSFFAVDKPTVPFVFSNDTIQLQVSTVSGSGEVKDTIVLAYDTDQSFRIPMKATAYDAVSPDVWELAREVSTLPYTESFSASSNLHNNYQLPGTTTDGKDAVFKLTLSSDTKLTTSFRSGENGKVGVYPEGFMGKGGPTPDNNIVANSHQLCNFESGDFAGFNCTNDPTYPWTIVSTNPHEGTYCIKSGNQSRQNTTSYFKMNVEYSEAGTIEFYSRISSESVTYDWGIFLIDDVEQYREGGASPNAWTLRSFPVTAGQHEFTWGYRKDGSNDTGEDAYYIDDITFYGAFGNVYHSGTYYIVASSTSDDFSVSIDGSSVPAPLVINNLKPENGYVVYETKPTQELTWWFGQYTTEYQLLVGETNPPTDVAVAWTSELAESYQLPLQNEKTYYWQVNERNSSGTTYGPVYTLSTSMLQPSANNIFYVKEGGSGHKEGSSWANAADNLNAVLEIAGQMSVKPQVWVAEGTYTGDGIADHNAFTIVEGVNVYGGFAGTETTLGDRDWESHPTILDGQNLQRVLYQSADFADANPTVWDGFIIEQGHITSGSGAGAWIRKQCKLNHCQIRNNTINCSSNIHVYGAGVRNSGGVIEDCMVYGNAIQHSGSSSYYGYGGGVYANQEAAILNCEIYNNSNNSSSSKNYGGGVYAYGAVNISGCVVRNNSVSGYGGGLNLYGNSSSTYTIVKDCRIENNESTNNGGGVVSYYAKLFNCLIANNTVTTSGKNSGGVAADYYSYITNCDIVNNAIFSSGSGAGVYVSNTATMTNTVVWGNRAGSSASNVYNNSNLTTYNCAVEGGWSGNNNVALASANTGSLLSPAFTAPTAGAGKEYSGGDWTLQDGSFLVNRGLNTATDLPEFDLAGNARIQQGVVDIGAYESPYTASSSVTPDENNIIYMTVEGAGLKDGSSWDNAIDDLNVVMAMATTMSTKPTVWMKEGRYVGDSIAGNDAFRMAAGVNVYGGFAGTETSLDDRDYATHPTILDGQRVQRVLCQGESFSVSTTWDGLIIENGRLTTTGSGAGAYLQQNGNLKNCIIRNDTIEYSGGNVYGGGVYLNGGSLDNCEVYGNYAHFSGTSGYYYCEGGGVYAGQNCSITNCVIRNNTSASYYSDYAHGGGLYTYGNSSNYNTVKDCRIENNTSWNAGGAYSYYSRFINCIVANNYVNMSGRYGGGMYTCYTTIVNCDLVNNAMYSSGSGAGIYVGSSTTMTNTVVWGNRIGTTPNNIHNSSGLTATYCAVEGGWSGTGNVILSEKNDGDDMSPKFTAPTAGAGKDYSGGDWTLQEGSFLVNRGNSSASYIPDEDIAGNDRIQQLIVDIGAYESPFDISSTITPDSNNIIYVTVEGEGAKDGSSWDNASDNLRLVLNLVTLMSPKPTIWVKEGTYVGDSIMGNNAFTMVAGVDVYGGFAGTETSLEERDYAAHPTILDGQNVQRVLNQSESFSALTTWDGFIIERGRLTNYSSGAGAYLRQNGRLKNCIIRHDTIQYNGHSYGGGVYMTKAVLENCEIYGNYSHYSGTSYSHGYGGGVYATDGSSITNCNIHHNTSRGYYTSGYAEGGGIYAGSNTTVSDCVITNNDAYGGYGGGICAYGGNSSNYARVVNCRIEQNRAYGGAGAYTYYTNMVNSIIANNYVNYSQYGGGVYSTGYSNLINCDIVNNAIYNSGNGGGFYSSSSNNTMVNCVVWGNKAGNSRNNISSSYLTATYCAVENGYNGIGNITLLPTNTGGTMSPMFTNPTEGAGDEYSGGDWTLLEGSILVNLGNNEASNLPETDLAGNARIQADRVDIGAYETPFTTIEITPDADNILYVTVSGAGEKNGSSWANASDDLNLVLAMASSMNPRPTVWVAEGTHVGDGVSTNAFRMYAGVNVYGGFAGNETSLEERNYSEHPTILDGQNLQRVLLQGSSYSEATSATWDGFIIERGRIYGGNGAGAYLLNYGKLRNCIIRNDTIMPVGSSAGAGCGGGVYTSYGTLENCEIYGNAVMNGTVNTTYSYNGGGVYMDYATITNCYIHDNLSQNSYSSSYSHGGGVFANNASSSARNYITNCRIENNNAYYGGGIYANSYCTVTGCNVANNTARDSGGGINASGSYFTLINSNVVNNLITATSGSRGPGLYAGSNYVVLTNNIIWGNMRNDTPDQYYFYYTPTLTYCAIQGGYDGTGNITLSAENDGSEMHPFFMNPTEGAGAAYRNGNWTLQEESFCINQGTTSGVSLPATDLAGNERVQMGAVDMGAYESPYNAVVITPDEHGIVYVTPTGAGVQDGSSWGNATSNLQLAVNRAGASGPDTNVWVAQGVYQGNGVEGGNAFVMPQNIHVYGGFVGNEAYDYDLSQRDLVNNATVLDGQGVQRVLFQRTDFAEANAAVWDGFSIMGGGGNMAGAGAYIQANGHLVNCCIYNNTSSGNVGGVYAYGSSSYGRAQLTNCRIYGNQGYYGGVYACYANLTNCLVEGNTGTNRGGGVYITEYATLLYCGIYNNTAPNNSAGVYVNNNNNTMQNTVIWGNHGNSINSSGSINVTCSAVEGGFYGIGNINLSASNTGDVMSPCFTNPSTGDWTLQSNSILINKGVIREGQPDTDLAGNLRVQQETPDMGPFESAYTGSYEIVPDTNGIVYVKFNGTGDGSSWTNACGDLQYAINRAATMNPKPVVWVAKGIYYTNSVNSINAFYITSGVNVYGGFAGNEAASFNLDERDLISNATILDGGGDHRVLYQKYSFSATTEATWDGFTIRNGYLTGSQEGAGVYMLPYSHLRNCVIKDNSANGTGGGIYCNGSSEIHNTITNCEIIDNESRSNSAGGVYMHYGLMTNCKVKGNSTSGNYNGGGVYASYSDVINCEVSENHGYYGSGIYSYYSDLFNSTIVNNTGTGYGLYIYAWSSSQLTNLIVWGNETRQLYNSGGNLTYSAVQGGVSGTGDINLNADNDGEGEGYYVRFLAPEFGIYQLRNDSPLIGMGNTGVAGLPDKDLAGRDRIMGGAIEPGAYEQYCTEYAHRTINAGGSYNFYGSLITQPGSYYHLWSFSPDCDSLVVADITMSSSRWYVTETGAGYMNGSSWENASNDLNAMLSLAARATGFEGREVWVAEGTYTGNTTGTNFYAVGGVAVYGGFAGNENSIAERNPEVHPTILSGSSNRVLLASSTEYPCDSENPGFMDGFTLQGGQQITLNANMTLQNCIIPMRTVSNGTLRQCEFTGFSDSGSQIMLKLNNGAVMDSCHVHHNLCRYALVRAEGATITNTLFNNNTCSRGDVGGENNTMYGAILNAIDNVTVDHCDFVNNRLEYTGTITPTLFVNMEGSSTCALRQPKHTLIALHNSTLKNTIVWGNEQNHFTQQFIAKDLASSIDYCAIEGNLYNGVGNVRLGSANEDGLFSPAFTVPITGAGHLISTDDSDLSLKSTSICLKQGENGSDIGAIASANPAVVNVTPSSDNVIFVDASGNGNGSSWAEATPYLQYAVARANTFEPTAAVWVKEGSYFCASLDSLTSAFNVVEGVSVYGGFAGTESTLEERNIEEHPTYLDGGNAHRVLYQNEPLDNSKAAVWDGFVIRNGYMGSDDFYAYGSALLVHPRSNSSYDMLQMQGAGALLMDNVTLSHTSFEHNQIVQQTNSTLANYVKGSALSMYGGRLNHVNISYDTTEYVSSANSMVNTYLYAIDAQIDNSTFANNIGKIALYGCTVNGTRFENNQVRIELPNTDDLNEAELYVDASTMNNCFISNNNAVALSRNFSNAQCGNTYINCQIDHNNALAVVRHSKAYNDTFINCNICNNHSMSTSSSAYPISGGIFHNTVVWGNRNYSDATAHFNGVTLEDNCSFNNCAVEHGIEGNDEVLALASSNTGTSLAYVYPCFLAPNGGDYELTNASALIDAGDGTVTSVGTDILGNPRVNDEGIDIGAYEYKCILYREYNDFCLANAYPFYGDFLTESGTYVHRWSISSECDSVVVLNLSFKRIIYVTENGSGLMNGTSWENAYGDLRLATEASGQNPMDRTQIWVAEGLYRGDGTSVNAFKLYPNVEMYGGLTGTELADYDLSQRDLEHHETILDGDYIQRVIYMVEDCTEETACVIDGFTIKNGYSRQDVNMGTALYLKKYVHIRNCKITQNYTWTGVEAIWMKTDYMEIADKKVIINTFENCEITDNHGDYAVCSDHTSFTNCKISANDGYGVSIKTYTKFDNCEFIGNGKSNDCRGHGVLLEGVGVYRYTTMMGGDIFSHDFMDMTNCVVKNNMGSGIHNKKCCNGHAEANIVSCVIDGNKATRGEDKRGGAIFGDNHDINIICSTIVNNQASSDGGALYGVDYHIVNTILANNKAGGKSNQLSNHYYEVIEGCNLDGSPLIYSMIQTTDIRYSAIEGGYPGEGNILLNSSDLLLNLNGYRLRENSVCINQGTTQGITIPEYDMAGNSRVRQGRIDIGAYESDFTGRTLIQPDVNNIIYVSKEGSEVNDGSSWENATSHFQMAMNFAQCYEPKPQIWVKEGEYDNLEEENVQFWSDLAIMPGLKVYGGFTGTEPASFQLADRELNKHFTILDGRNKRRVLEQLDSYSDADRAVWDGFIIRHGYAEKGYTGNIKYISESGVIAYFKNYMNGGGILLRDGADIDNCDIYDNVAYVGGGLYRGTASGTANYLRNDKIRRNYAIEEGGGLFYGRSSGYFYGTSAVDTIANCEISGNTSDRHAAIVSQRANLINCSVIKNKTEIYSFDTITSTHQYNRYVNCVLWGNDSRNYAWQTDGRDNTYDYCAIQGGRDGVGNINLELENTGDDPTLHYPAFIDSEEEVYQPSENSALINVGNNDYACGEKDLAYHDRVQDAVVDMGAYEQHCILYRHMHVIHNKGYEFYGQLLNTSGNYQYQFTPEGMDCDSLISLDLEIRKIWYVSEGGSGTKDGTSWDNAMDNLNTALDAAANCTTDAKKQIWVSEGTYTGDGNSAQAFKLRPNVEIYGGFPENPGNGFDIDDRDVAANPTILDGSHSQRVLGNYGNESSFGPTARGYVDGFVIKNGYTTKEGGGVYAKNYITIKNCDIQYNQGGNGAGVYIDNRCQVRDCNIYRNTALHDGGGAYVKSSELTYCQINNNLCDNTDPKGTRRGGGIYGVNATINNCLIANNSALTDKAMGGGMYIAISQVPSQLLNCTMVNNYSYNLAGGIYSENSGSNNEFINCVLWGNRTDLNHQQVAVSGTNVPIYLRYCAVQDGCAGIGTITLPAENNSSSIYAPRFVAPSANVGANYEGGDWHFADGSILANHGERMTYTLTYDLDGPTSQRVKNDRIDIGAYESNTVNDYALVPDAHNTIYVNAANTGGNLSGDSWANALPDLQMAINFAGDDDNRPKIWIAGGTYPSNGWPYVDAFVAMNGVDLYGGFAGNEPYDYDLELRDFNAHQTILDGQNIQRTLQQAQSDYFKYRKIETLQSATYDGLTIRNGFAYRKDGGNVLMWKGDLRNCIVENGHVLQGEAGGGGICGNNNVRVSQTIFRNNKAESCTGGMTGYAGGGAGCGNITYRDCLFANNSALSCYHGGGATDGGTHYNSTIVNNYATGEAGGVYYGALYNSILWGNKVGNNEPCSLPNSNLSASNPFGELTVNYSAIEGGYMGIGNISLAADNTGTEGVNYPMFTNPSIAAGVDYSGGDWTLQDGSVCVNHGNNAYVAEGDFDLTHATRIQHETVDMGCYESDHVFDFEIVPDANNIIYVTTEGAGLKNGSSWANATPYLEYALERATLYNPKPDIWIAEGVYTGDGVPYHPAFLLPNGVDIHGGFVGNEPASYDLAQRDLESHITVFDGQNLQQIIRRDNANSTYNYITGITFQNGRSNRNGGAASLTTCQIEYCKFTNNSYVREGGDGGGALYASNCRIYHCEFTNNYSLKGGGGIYNQGNNVINWCLIKNNTAVGNGGGISGSCDLYNSEISYNHSERYGGGINGSPKMWNCDVVKNTVNVSSSGTGTNGGGMYLAGASDGFGGTVQNLMSNNIIWGNRAGAVVSNLRGTLPGYGAITYTAVESDESIPGGIGNIVIQSANTGDDPSLYYVRFSDPDNGDFTLMETPQSMCIDAGNNSYAAPGDFDLLGNERIRNSVVDMGCYEQTPVDCHAPTNLNIPEELITFTTADVNWDPGDDEDQWMVYYIQVGSSTPHIVTVDTNYIQLQELHPNLQYMVKVRSKCDNQEMSCYTVPQYFHTACDPDSIVWTNTLVEEGLLPSRDQALPSNSTVLFSWNYIDGADYYDLYLWRTDHGNGLPIPSFPVRRNVRNNYTTVDLARSEYDGYGVYDHCQGWECDPEPPAYLYQNDTTGVAFYAWYVVAHKDCATIQSDTMTFSSGLPDLHVTALDCSYAQTGQLMTVEWSVKNDGNIPTPTGATWTDYIVLSYPINWDVASFTAPNPESFVMAEVPNLIALDTNMQYTNQCNIFIPDDMYGSVFLFVLSNWEKYSAMHLNFDQYGGVFPNPYTPDPSGYPYYYMSGSCSSASFDEINECDNFFYKNIEVDIPPYPDLIASDVIPPYEGIAGDSITVSWRVTNQGSAGFENMPVTDVVYMTTDTIMSGGVITLGSINDTLTLMPGESIVRHARLATNERNIDTFNFFVRTDATNMVYESLFEGNNVSSISEHPTVLLPAPPPDLAFEELYLAKHSLSPNEWFRMKYKVVNIGFSPAKPNVGDNGLVDTCGVVKPWRGIRWTDKIYISEERTPNAIPLLNTYVGDNFNDTILYTVSEVEEAKALLNEWADCHFSIPDTLSANASHADSVRYARLVAQALADKQEYLEEHLDLYKNSYEQSFQVKIPEMTQEGLYYYYVKTDAGDQVFEYQHENNNIIFDSVYVFQPDLTVCNIAIDPARDSVSFGLTNIGLGKFINNWVDVTVNFNNSEAGSTSFDELNLDPGDTLWLKCPISIPCNFFAYNSLKVQATPVNDKNFANNNMLIENYQLFNPDFLAVSSSLVVPTELNSGENFDIVYDISNLGDTLYQGDISLGVYLGYSPELNFITATQLKLESQEITLNVNESVTVVQNVTLPIEAEGQYYLYVVVNDGDAICEGDNVQSNYIVSPAIDVSLSPYPDLLVVNAITPGDGTAGMSATVSYTATNQGIRALTASEKWTDAIYISNSPTFSVNTAEQLALIHRSGPLAIGDTYSEERTFTLPVSLANDNYFFYIVTDKADDIFEYVGEYNNTYQGASFPVQEYSLDLAVNTIDGPTDIEWNQVVEYTYTVSNNGSRPTVSSYTDGLYLSTDATFDANDYKLGSYNVSGLSAGGSYPHTMSVRIPYGYTGTYYILAVTDVMGKNPDSNSENNVKALQVNITTIPVPDLEVSDVSIVTEYPSCGQPIRVSYKVTNVGDGPTYGTYVDRLVYSRNTFNAGTQFANITRDVVLQPDEYYYDTLSFIVPVPNTGNYAVYVSTNHNEEMFEMNRENNLGMVPVVVTLNAPGDLVVTEVNHPAYVTAGESMTVTWKVRNLGPNELSGVGYSDVVYISNDTVFDSDDKLLGHLNYDNNLTFPLYTDIEHSLTANISGLQEGDYYIIVLADARNTFFEENEDNNRGYSVIPFHVELPILPFNRPVTFDLANFQYKDFKLPVGSNISETVRIYVLSGDSLMGAVNNIYVLKDAIGTNMNYDFSTDGQMTCNSEVYIPRTESGYYGVSVFGYSPVNNSQQVTIEADILPFEVRSITPNYGGNTGKVTVKLIGSKFRYDMDVQLFKCSGNDTIRIFADTLMYKNFNEVFVTFNLKGAELGTYSLRADNYCAGSAYLHNCFNVVEGEPENLATNLIIPSGLRAHRYCCLTLEYGNIGNTDIVNPRIELVSLGEAWIGLRRGELNIHRVLLEIPTLFEGEPDGILRPGVRHTITIYCYTNEEMTFQINVNDEIDVHHYHGHVQDY